MKHFINGVWYTDLGLDIAINDCLNNMRRLLKEYEELHQVEQWQWIKRKRK